MKRKLAIMAVILSALSGLADLSALIPYTVPVETSKPLQLSVMRGESVTWQVAFTENGLAKSLAGAQSVALTYSRTGVTWQVMGSIQSATGGTVRVSWTSTNATPAASYSYVMSVTTGTVSLCRARGTLTVEPGVSAVTGTGPVWSIDASIAASIAVYSNHVRNVYIRGVESSPGVWQLYIGD